MTLSSLPAISCRNGVEFRNRANLVLVRVSELAAHSLAALVAATTLLSIATGAAANAQPFSQGAAQRAESSLNDPVSQFWDVPAAVEFGRVAAAPVNTLRQQTHRCQEISVCF